MLILVSLQRVKNEKTKKQNKKVTLISYSSGILPKKSGFEGEKHIEKRRNV